MTAALHSRFGGSRRGAHFALPGIRRFAFAALQSAGFYYDDVMKAEMRSPKGVEARAKARGLEIPKDLIGSRRSGVSLVRSENVRVPVPGRVELARTFSEALEAFQEGRQL
jgi:hypothetical protein